MTMRLKRRREPIMINAANDVAQKQLFDVPHRTMANISLPPKAPTLHQDKRFSRRRSATELQESLALIEWSSLRDIPLVHHCNEGKRSPWLGMVLKQSGLAPGFPDFSLNRAHGGYFGLFIELKCKRSYSKSEQNTKSWKNQSAWLTELANSHYYATRCFGWENAKQVIEKYLSWPRTMFYPLQNICM